MATLYVGEQSFLSWDLSMKIDCFSNAADNLDPNVPEERLSEEFSMAGRVIKVSIKRDFGDDDSPAFAYVTFEKKSNGMCTQTKDFCSIFLLQLNKR